MKWFSDLKIRAKLIYGFMAVGLIAAVIGVLGVTNLASINRISGELYKENVIPLSPIHQIAVDFQRIRVNLRDEIFDNQNQQRYESTIRQLITAIDQNFKLYERKIRTQKEREIFNDLRADIQTYIRSQEKVMELARLNRDQEAYRAMTAFKQVALDADAHITQLFKFNTELADRKNKANNATAHSSSLWMILILIAGALLSTGLGFLIAGNISKPLVKLSQQAEKLAQGNTDVHLDAQFVSKDEIGELTSSFAQFIANFVTPLNEATEVLKKMAVNDYTAAMNGAYHGVVKELAEQINTVQKRLLSVQDIAQRVSRGDTSRLDEFIQIGKRSDNDQLIPAFRAMMQSIRDLISETTRLADAAVQGDLALRGNETKFEGGYREIISGMNKTMDAVAEPICEASQVLSKMSVNDISLTMKGSYQGTFQTFAAEINQVQERLASIQDAFIRVAKGDLSRLAEMKKIGRRSENDQLLPAMTDMMEAIQGLLGEVGALAKAAQSGDLTRRADVAGFQGAYREVVAGLNQTIDAFLNPISEANQVLRKLAVNDYTSEMTGKYQGALQEFADQINMVRTRLLSVQDIALRVSKGDTSRLEEFVKIGKRSENDKLLPAFREMMQTIQDLILEAGSLAKAAVSGNLTIRGNEAKFEGGYREVICGMNQTMAAVAEPIREAAEVLREMAQGNLAVAMTGVYQGDYAVIKESVNETIESFNHILNDINNAASQVASGSKQLSDASIALSQGATEQASTIEELTASLEEIASQTKLNAGHANEANTIAETVKTNADQGNQQMKEMLQAMDEINKASGSISRIIKVIDEIAFQTNILALNAAVEAARAGQYGKGFAVVAEEVRNLAARSADAAKETTDMIEGSIHKVEDGTRIANQTAGALAKIVEGVGKVAGLIGNITIASNEQATGIAQINQGIIQVSQVVQTNTATSEESASSSEELAGQAEMLKQQIAGFRLKRSVRSFNPEELKMIDNEIGKRKIKTAPDYPVETLGGGFKKIALTANEFGKY